MRIAVFTTSYPRHPEDYAGRFVSDQVDRLRVRGHDVDVVKPGVYRDFGLCYGNGTGLFPNLRRKPWLAPLLFLTMVVALRKAARHADVVHAHWLAGAVIALFSGKPFVVTLHGSPSAGRFQDTSLMRKIPGVIRWILNRAATTICVGQPLADLAAEIGVRNAVVLRNGVDLDNEQRQETVPPFVLYVGRLASEKGIEDLASATAGLPLVVAGDGPLRHLLDAECGIRPHSEVRELYRQAGCLVLSSYNEGSPTVIIEAMAHGCPVVSTAVADAPFVVADGETGFIVPIGDSAALRNRLQTVLADGALRDRFSVRSRERIAELCGWDSVLPRLVQIYQNAAGRQGVA